jgi:integrase
VPLHASTRKVLAKYLAHRKRWLAGMPDSSYLFVNALGRQLEHWEMYTAFVALSRQVGLRAPNRPERPRMHDFRHRFATRTLMHWYRSGEDPERRLPILSTYLGHAHVSDTYWYLNNWPELMREGMRRLERRWERRS